MYAVVAAAEIFLTVAVGTSGTTLPAYIGLLTTQLVLLACVAGPPIIVNPVVVATHLALAGVQTLP
ncbi:hypothetical protein D3C87_1776300 [compost metagenome]